MDTAGYVALSRQAGLAKDLQAVANNIANLSTSGYRRESLIFAEHVAALPVQGGSVALTDAHARITSTEQGALKATGGTFDLAIEGEGFFTVDTPRGLRLTRAGAFGPNAAGEVVSPQGYRLLDSGGAPVFIPPGSDDVRIAGDGTMTADGQPVAQVGRVSVDEPWRMTREDGVLFRTDAPLQPAENGAILQGFLEQANVNPVSELARMITVQRAYEAGQKLLEREDDRIRRVLDTVTAPT